MDTRVKSIEFIEDKHEYWFTDEQGRHRRLHGVTGAIGKLMGKSFPDTDTVKLATMYGSDVHKEVENYFTSMATGSMLPSCQQKVPGGL